MIGHEPAADIGTVLVRRHFVGNGINASTLDGAASVLVGIVDVCRKGAVLGGSHGEKRLRSVETLWVRQRLGWDETDSQSMAKHTKNDYDE